MLSWRVFMKFKPMLYQRNTSVSALIVKQIWKLFRLLKQRPHWYGRARALNDISTYHSVGLFGFPGHSGISGNEIADELAREVSVHHFVGPEPVLGVSRQSINKKIQCWLDQQHTTLWQGLAGTQKQARELISGTCTAAKTRLLSFSRMQSRVVTGLLTGHNTLRRHLHMMGQTDSPDRGAQQRKRPQLTFCVSVKLWRHSDILIWVASFWSLRAIWNFIKRTVLPWIGLQLKGHNGNIKGLRASGPKGLYPSLILFYSIYSILFPPLYLQGL